MTCLLTFLMTRSLTRSLTRSWLLLGLGVAALVVLWAGATPPPSSTVAPGASAAVGR